MSERTCKTCGCWKRTGVGGDGKPKGECRASHPVLALDYERSVFGYWPEVWESDWCGDHTAFRPCELPGPERGR